MRLTGSNLLRYHFNEKAKDQNRFAAVQKRTKQVERAAATEARRADEKSARAEEARDREVELVRQEELDMEQALSESMQEQKSKPGQCG